MNDEPPVAPSIGRYQVLEELGRGAMGIVYRGFDPVIRRTVALKTMAFSAQDAESRALRDRLYREAAAAGTLTHPSIVTIYDIIDDGATTAVAMEFVEGQTLADVLTGRGALPLEDALAIFEPICAALDYAGSKGIVHRDIKPANILLTRDGRPKIMDFGIARIAMQGQTQTSTIMGSPSYMSPEQVRGLPLDPRSDLFSAAVVFFEMIAGERPFGGDDVATTMYRIVNEPPRAVDQLVSTISPAVAGVLEWALSKNPAERYQTGGELITALRSAKHSGAPAPAPAPYGEPYVSHEPAIVAAPVEAPAARRSPLMLFGVIGSGVLLLAVVLAIVFGGGLGQPTREGLISGGGAAPDAGPVASPVSAATPPVSTASSPTAVADVSAGRAVAEPSRATSSDRPAAGPGAPADTKVVTRAVTPAENLAAKAVAPSPTPAAPSPTPAAPSPTPAAPLPATATPPATPAAPAPSAAPPVSVAPPPSPEAAAPAGTASAVFVVKGEDYAGVRILVDDRLLPGPYPAQVGKLAAGSHRVIYRWVSGAPAGREISESIVVAAGGHFIIRAALDSEKLVVQQLR